FAANLTTRGHRASKVMFDHLAPVIERRLEVRGQEGPNKPVKSPLANEYDMLNTSQIDCMQYLIDTSPRKAPWTVQRTIGEIMAVWFSSVHQLAMAATFALEDLCMHPECVEPLRQELEGYIDGAAVLDLDAFPLLDSFLKESSRLSVSDAIRRKALKDLDCFNGTHVNEGDWVCVAQRAMMHDSDHYSDPEAFDAFRFARKRPNGQSQELRRFTDVKPDWLIWGYGNTTCPGRFYASAVLRLLLCHVLANFDMQLLDKGATRTMTWRSRIRSEIVLREGVVNQGLNLNEHCAIRAITELTGKSILSPHSYLVIHASTSPPTDRVHRVSPKLGIDFQARVVASSGNADDDGRLIHLRQATNVAHAFALGSILGGEQMNGLSPAYVARKTHSDSGYDASLKSYFSQQEAEITPYCIVSPLNESDVSAAIKILAAPDSTTKFAIRGGGHTVWKGSANIEDGVTIDMRNLNTVKVSEDKTVISVGAGALWRDVYTVTDSLGLATSGGRAAQVGVGGLTTGGGLSFFSARYGFVCDNVLSYDIVLADGSLVSANETTNPDLWVALRGGSNNFGVVTKFHLRTFPQIPFYGGQVFYSLDTAPQQIDAFAQLAGAEDFDENASLITSFSYTEGVGGAIQNSLKYVSPVLNEKPAVFQPFLEIGGQLGLTMRVSNVTDFTTEQGAFSADGFRYVVFFPLSLSLPLSLPSPTHTATPQIPLSKR
ncbi:MAG: hypothetical protein Q9205_007354, partial [Flavoplaca limonia]